MARPCRREVLRACSSVGIVGLSGCSELYDGGAGGGCSDERRWDIAFGDRLAFGRNEGFRMTGAPGTISFGDELTVRLRNAVDESLRTGTSEKHTIQSRRDGGWQNVLVEPDGFDGAAVNHPPGEGFTWRFTVETDGYGGPWEVCGPLTPGTYRFVYWGLGDAPPTATPGDPDRPHFAVAFRFSVRE